VIKNQYQLNQLKLIPKLRRREEVNRIFISNEWINNN
jgi:hypothetical protein